MDMDEDPPDGASLSTNELSRYSADYVRRLEEALQRSEAEQKLHKEANERLMKRLTSDHQQREHLIYIDHIVHYTYVGPVTDQHRNPPYRQYLH